MIDVRYPTTDVRSISPIQFNPMSKGLADVLGSVSLPSGAMFTATARTIVEGNTLTIRYRAFLDGQDDADFPAIRRWDQLELTSATAQVQYKATVDSANIADFMDSDIRYSGYNYHGEHVNDAAAGNVLNLNTVYFRTSNNQWRGASSNAGGMTEWADFDQDTGLLQPVTWLGSLSDAELTTYFQENTYDSSRNYYFYQESSGQVRKYTETTTVTWTELMTGDEHNGVESDELTVDVSELKDNGVLRITLADDSIDMDSENFRVQITLND